jgi:hypothetical protein
MESSPARKLIGIGACVAVAGLALSLWDRRSYVADVRFICTAEGPAETTIVKSRTLVEALSRKNIRGDKGLALIEGLKKAAPDAAASQLQEAAEGAGVTPCPAVASYQTLASRVVLQKNAERMCTGMNPGTLAKSPRASRFATLMDWTHTNVTEPALDELLASIDKAGTSPADKTARLKTSLSDLGIHECGVLSGLASPLESVLGPNVRIQSVSLQSDAREKVVADDLRSKLPAFRECYDKGLAKDPALAGNVVVKFLLAESGSIDFALVQEDSSIYVPAVSTCVVDVVKSAKWPKGPGKTPGGLDIAMWTAK